MSRPNILYIHSHDTGRMIQPMGHPVHTPRLQQLAEEGVLFRKAFCAGPTCSPSRVALLTGQSPHSAGMIGLAHRGFRMHDYGQHLCHTMKAAGYRTCLAGLQHEVDKANVDELGYDQVLSNGSADELAASFLAGAAADSDDRPFLLTVGFFMTHRAKTRGHVRGSHHPDAEQADARYCMPPALLPDTPETRADWADFQLCVTELDTQMGRVFDALENAGLADNTLVICTTDHGIAYPGYKCNLTDAGMGVHMIMRGPGGFAGGRVIDSMVSHIDVFPTLCEYLEIPSPDWLQGRSLMPLIAGDATEVHDEIFSEVTYHAAYEPKRAVRTARWKYIRQFTDRKTRGYCNCDDSLSRQYWWDHGWQDMHIPGEQLYDLVLDPMEVNNLAGDARCVDVLADMQGRLDRWMARTDDPLLAGPVPVPEGAWANDPDEVFPTSRPSAKP